MKDYTQRNFDKLCAALTMDELANFMDCLPLNDKSSKYDNKLVGSLLLTPSKTLWHSFVWHLTNQGHSYWNDVCTRLEADET